MEIIVVDYKALKLEEEKDLIISKLSEEDRERIGRFRMSADRIRGAVSAVLSRSMAAEAFPEREIVIGRTERGKPYLVGAEGFFFNISHSGNLIVYASSGKSIGVDVESEKSVQPEKFRRFFSPEEMKMLSSDPEPEKLFFRIWTVREAFTKMTGLGIAMLEQELPIDHAKKQVQYQGKSYSFETTEYQDHVISLCMEDHIGEMGLRIVTREEWDGMMERI